jgi:hypothetical protein
MEFNVLNIEVSPFSTKQTVMPVHVPSTIQELIALVLFFRLIARKPTIAHQEAQCK